MWWGPIVNGSLGLRGWEEWYSASGSISTGRPCRLSLVKHPPKGIILRFAAYGSKEKRMFPPSPPDLLAVLADEFVFGSGYEAPW
jgi:hypothetical protein